MKTIIKYLIRVIIGLIIFIFFFAGALFLTGYYYADEAKQLIVAELNKSLTVKVKVNEIDITLIKNFPKAAIRFTDISTQDDPEHPLLKAGDLLLLFDIYDLFSGDYTIEELILRNAQMNADINRDYSDNFHIFKKKEDRQTSTVKISLDKIILENVAIRFRNQPDDKDYFFVIEESNARGEFTSEQFLLDFKGNLLSNYFRAGKTKYLPDQRLYTKLTADVNTRTGKFLIKEGKVDAGDLSVSLTGQISTARSDRNIDLSLKSEQTSVKSLLGLIPEGNGKGFKTFNPDGKISIEGKITGDFSGERLPSMNFNFSLRDGILHNRKPDFTVKNISFSGNFDNGTLKSNSSSVIRIRDLKAGLTAGNIEGDITITNLDDPVIDVRFNSSVTLDRIDEIVSIDNLQHISGNLKFDLQFTNNLKTINQFTVGDFISSKTSGAMKLSDVSLQLKNDPISYTGLNGTFKFNNKDLVVENFTGKVGNSDFRMKGYFLNILAFALSPGEHIKVKADFASSEWNMADLLSDKKDQSGAKYRLRFSNRISFDLDLNIKKFTFGKFRAENITGKVNLRDKKLEVSNTTFDAMEGRTMLAGKVDGSFDDKFRVSFTAGLDGVNIRQMFYELSEFGQQNITSDHLRGKLDATIYYRSFIDPGLKIDAASVYALGDLAISEGELIRYTPLYKLSKYLKQRELEHIRFSTLKNQIEIKEQIVYIPEMDIASSTLNLRLYGTHTFGNSIDYHISILLADLISKGNKQKEEPIEGIFPEEDGLGKPALYLSMKGNVDDPDISYDTRAVRKKIGNDLKKEQQTLKDIFRKEFSEKGQSTSETNEKALATGDEKGRQFKIEWDESTKDEKLIDIPKSPKKKPGSKSSKNDFVIEWDEANDSIR